MTITYKTNDQWPGVEFPVLHRVVYGYSKNQIDDLYHRGYLDIEVDAWLASNCRSPYYRSPGWNPEKSIQFEDDEEAFRFALRYAA